MRKVLNRKGRKVTVGREQVWRKEGSQLPVVRGPRGKGGFGIDLPIVQGRIIPTQRASMLYSPLNVTGNKKMHLKGKFDSTQLPLGNIGNSGP